MPLNDNITNPLPRKVCTVCGKAKQIEKKFWRKRDGTRFDICKECACEGIDNSKPETFLWILKEADVPFIEEKWIDLCKKRYKRDPFRFGPSSVIGTYLQVMWTPRYIDYHYDDAQSIKEKNTQRDMKHAEIVENAKRAQAASKELMADLDISPTIDIGVPSGCEEDEDDIEFELEEPVTEDVISKPPVAKPEPEPESEPVIEPPKPQEPVTLMSTEERRILEELTPEETEMLLMKWGDSFTPSEWVKMEDMFQKYCNEYEMDVDREEVLKSLCKTNINMQRCLDASDAQNATKFSSMFDQLRKSGAFTTAQKKEEKQRYLDSVGELVAAVEREGGIIEKFDSYFEVSDDKVDLTLKDMQSYTYNLVKNEMGLGTLIESYIKKLDESMHNDKANTSFDDLYTSIMDEQEAQEEAEANAYLDNLADSVRKSADAILDKIGDGGV